MQFFDRIDAIEGRAKRLNLTLCGICREADVDYTTVLRWRKSIKSPTVRALEKNLGKLERALAFKERDMLARLSADHAAAPLPAERLSA